jgi:hypothetical protein
MKRFKVTAVHKKDKVCAAEMSKLVNSNFWEPIYNEYLFIQLERARAKHLENARAAQVF